MNFQKTNPASGKLLRTASLVLLSAVMVSCSNSGTKRPSQGLLGIFSENKENQSGLEEGNALSIPTTSDQTKFSSRDFGVAGSPRITKSKRVKKGGGYYKLGKPYKIRGKRYIPRHDPNYKKTGLASWYGPNFHGRLTANGEIYDQYSLSAAHPTMPLPSYAKVTNLQNGASVTVRVNDRGPYAHNRLIDLSSRAAQLLGYTKQGVAKVRVEYVGKAPLHGLDEEYLVASYNPGRLNPNTIPPNAGGPVLVADAGNRSNSQSSRTNLQAYDQNGFSPPVPEFRPLTLEGYPVDISSLNKPRPNGLVSGYFAPDFDNHANDAIKNQFGLLPLVEAPENGMNEVKQIEIGPFSSDGSLGKAQEILAEHGSVSLVPDPSRETIMRVVVVVEDLEIIAQKLRKHDLPNYIIIR